MSSKSVKIEKAYNWVVAIDEQGVRRLYNEILNQLKTGVEKKEGMTPSIKITISYSDNSSVTTFDIEDLLKDENISGREIVKIIMESKLTDRRIFVSFGGKNNTANIQIVGPDRQWAYVTKSIIEERLKDFRESRPRTGILIFISLIILIFTAYFITPFLRSYLPPLFTSTSEGKRDLGMGMLILGGIFLIVFIILCYFIGKLFPNSFFLIGKGIKRYAQKARIRSNLLWVVGIGFLISILVSLLTKVF